MVCFLAVALDSADKIKKNIYSERRYKEKGNEKKWKMSRKESIKRMMR